MSSLLAAFLAYLLPGFLLGVIEAWNKKALLAVLVIAAVLSIAIHFVGGHGAGIDTTVLEFLANVAGVAVGLVMGKWMYTEAFGDD